MTAIFIRSGEMGFGCRRYFNGLSINVLRFSLDAKK